MSKGGKRGSVRSSLPPDRSKVTKNRAPKRWLAYKDSKYEDPEYFDGDAIVLSVCGTIRDRLGENVPAFLAASEVRGGVEGEVASLGVMKRGKKEGEIIVIALER